MKLTLANKIRLAVIGIVAALSLFMLIFFPSRQEKALLEGFGKEVQSLAETVTLGVSIGLESGDLSLAQQAMDFAERDGRVRFVAWITEGETFAARPEGFEFNPNALSSDLVVKQVQFKTEDMSGEIVVGSSTDTIRKSIRKVQVTAIIASSVALLFGLSCALWLARSISVPILALSNIMQDIAQGEGDLTKRLAVTTKDEIGELAHWFNVFVEKIHGIINQAASVTGQVATSATELSGTAEQIAAGSQQTASQTDTVAASTEELSTTAGEIAYNCTEAAQEADAATRAAEDGREVVDQTISGMNQIAERVKASAVTIQTLQESSQKIGDILGVIDDIASQTNLLALNAAIEAARAGEQGRGFAVVADEVRKLAESTAQSTQEIAAMIKTIQGETQNAVASMEQGVQEVESGTELASQAGEALETISQRIAAVTDMIRQVATAAGQQTATTNDITENIQQATGVIQQSAEGAQQSAQAAIELAELSNQLQNLVGQFKLRRHEQADSMVLIEPQETFAAVPTNRFG